MNLGGNTWTFSWTVAFDHERFQALHSPGGYYWASYSGTYSGNDSIYTGDELFYDWHSDGLVDHMSIQASYGTDPNSGWYGDLVDQHSTNHYHAYWTLQPYNAQASTTTIDEYHLSPSNWGYREVKSNPYFTAIRVRGVYRTILIAVVAVISVAALSASLALRASATPDEVAIQQVVRGALAATHSLEVPPPAYQGGVMPDAFNQQMIDRVPAVLSQYYAGTPLTRNINAIQANIRADKSGKIRYLAGGVENLVFTSISVTGSTALVSVSLTAWTRVAQDQNGKLVQANPHNDVDYTFTLTKATGRWLIDSEAWSFRPGSAP
jgi:putative amidase-like protein